MKKPVIRLSEDALRIIVFLIGSVVATVILLFSILALANLQNNDIETASYYLFIIFIVVAISRFTTFIKERSKIAFLRFLILFIFDIVVGILILFAKDNSYFFSMCSALFCLTIIVSRIFKLIEVHTIRSIVLNGIIMTIFALLAIGLFIPYESDIPMAPALIVCIAVVLSAMIEVFSIAFSSLKVKVLFKIIIRTFALEIILGLFTMIVASALILMFVEKDIPTFGDGLWYAFAVVTTIGFGDYVAVTGIGRAVTVLLGIYGIVVVAVITSIIVNFYNETAGKKDAKEMKEIHEESQKDNGKKNNKGKKK